MICILFYCSTRLLILLTSYNVIQLHSSLETNRKRKRDEIDNDFADKAYGIVTDGRAWYFVEFIMDDDKPKISVHSETLAILDWTEESEALEKGGVEY